MSLHVNIDIDRCASIIFIVDHPIGKHWIVRCYRVYQNVSTCKYRHLQVCQYSFHCGPSYRKTLNSKVLQSISKCLFMWILHWQVCQYCFHCGHSHREKIKKTRCYRVYQRFSSCKYQQVCQYCFHCGPS